MHASTPIFVLRQIWGWKHLDRQAFAVAIAAVPAFSDTGSLQGASTMELFDIFTSTLTDIVDWLLSTYSANCTCDLSRPGMMKNVSKHDARACVQAVRLKIEEPGYTSYELCVNNTGWRRVSTGNVTYLFQFGWHTETQVNLQRSSLLDSCSFLGWGFCWLLRIKDCVHPPVHVSNHLSLHLLQRVICLTNLAGVSTPELQRLILISPPKSSELDLSHHSSSRSCQRTAPCHSRLCSATHRSVRVSYHPHKSVPSLCQSFSSRGLLDPSALSCQNCQSNFHI